MNEDIELSEENSNDFGTNSKTSLKVQKFE